MNNGWIKLYRELLNKPIWKLSTPEQKSILIAILLLASHKNNEWEWKGEKFTTEPGQFVTSLDNIKKAAGKGISVQNIRTALVRFEKLQFLTNKSTKCGRLISIINWDSYQDIQNEPNKDIGKGVTKTSQRPNTYQECNNVNNEKKKNNNGILPDFISKELWQEFKIHRAKLKSPMTEKAEKLAIDKITELSKKQSKIAQALIEQSIENGWKGIFPLKGSIQQEKEGLFPY